MGKIENMKALVEEKLDMLGLKDPDLMIRFLKEMKEDMECLFVLDGWEQVKFVKEDGFGQG